MPTLNIGLLLYPGCMPAGLFSAADLLQAANLRCGKPAFQVHWVGLQAGPVECAHGVRLEAREVLGSPACSAVLVPGFWAASVEHLHTQLRQRRPLIDALASLDRSVALWSYCTGVALAAEAGRLRGQPATATWWMARWLEQAHPQVDWQWQQPCVVHRRNVTASGVHGYLPILCDRVERNVSAEAWRDLNRLLVLPRPQPGASVFESLEPMSAGDPLLRRLRRVVESLPASELTVEQLAPALALSPRTLSRKVSQCTGGDSVAAHVRLIKLHQAGERLLHTQQSVAQVCAGLGFADESSFRRMFKRVTGHTPAEYRQLYRA